VSNFSLKFRGGGCSNTQNTPLVTALHASGNELSETHSDSHVSCTSLYLRSTTERLERRMFVNSGGTTLEGGTAPKLPYRGQAIKFSRTLDTLWSTDSLKK